MEIAKVEFDAVKEAVVKGSEVVELKDLELSLIGGGCGDISLG